MGLGIDRCVIKCSVESRVMQAAKIINFNNTVLESAEIEFEVKGSEAEVKGGDKTNHHIP